MHDTDGKKRGFLSLSDGGLAGQRRTRSALEAERVMRELLVAMRRRDGKAAVNKNFRNVARGHTTPWGVLLRRFREAKAARNDAHNYPLMKATLRTMDEWVDHLHGKTLQTDEHKPAA